MTGAETVRFLCIAGKNDIAVDVLRWLLDRHPGIETGVICNRGETGRNSFQKSLRYFAGMWGVREYSLDEVYDREGQVFLSLEFDRLVRPDRFRDARLFNIHFSLLPAYKGMYTSAMPILNGEKKTGVTFHRIDAGIDTGGIIDQEEFSIDGMDCREVYLECIARGTETVIRNLESVLGFRERPHAQGSAGSTYYSRASIDYGNLRLDLNQTAEGISRQIRAFRFREYQLPEFEGRGVIDYAVTGRRSVLRPGKKVMEAAEAAVIATADYDMILFFDRLEELMDACREGDMNAVRDICSVPRHINETDARGWSPLMAAVHYGRDEAARYLLLHGADIHARDHDGANLLMHAEDGCMKSGSSGMLRLLLQMGLSPEERDYAGRNAYDRPGGAGAAFEELIKK